MLEPFLYEQLDTLSQWGSIKKEVPDSVAQNLNPKYELRPYQIEAFARFFIATKMTSRAKPIPCTFFSTWRQGAARRSSWRG